jgi:hypothetical protein
VCAPNQPNRAYGSQDEPMTGSASHWEIKQGPPLTEALDPLGSSPTTPAGGVAEQGVQPSPKPGVPRVCPIVALQPLSNPRRRPARKARLRQLQLIDHRPPVRRGGMRVDLRGLELEVT